MALSLFRWRDKIVVPYKCVLLNTRERKYRRRREANLDHWIGRRTFSLCTSQPRLALIYNVVKVWHQKDFHILISMCTIIISFKLVCAVINCNQLCKLNNATSNKIKKSKESTKSLLLFWLLLTLYYWKQNSGRLLSVYSYSYAFVIEMFGIIICQVQNILDLNKSLHSQGRLA